MTGWCVECGQAWPCDPTVRRVKDGIPHRLAAIERPSAWPTLDEVRAMTPDQINAWFASVGCEWRVAAPSAPSSGSPSALAPEQIAARALHWKHTGEIDLCLTCSHDGHEFAARLASQPRTSSSEPDR